MKRIITKLQNVKEHVTKLLINYTLEWDQHVQVLEHLTLNIHNTEARLVSLRLERLQEEKIFDRHC